MNENELSNIVIGMAIKVHDAVGTGLLESAYKECLAYKIAEQGLKEGIKRVVNNLYFREAYFVISCYYQLRLSVIRLSVKSKQ